MTRPIRDRCWALITGARGHVQGKTFHMRGGTLAAALREAGESVSAHSPTNPQLRGRTLYGVRVVLDPLMRFGEVRLK